MHALKQDNRSIEEGDHVKLLCRRKGVFDGDEQPEIKWTWTSAANESITQRFDENETNWLPGSQVHFERHSGFELSYVEWENVTANASGSYQCSHAQVGSSAVYKLQISCKFSSSLLLMLFHLSFLQPAATACRTWESVLLLEESHCFPDCYRLICLKCFNAINKCSMQPGVLYWRAIALQVF